LAALLPDLPVVRMDADTTKGKGGHERALAQFEALEAGVLLGTQMIAKGLDYPEVTLVGVINADTTLHLPDFRAGERTYQLLEQVSGRAGRGDRQGRVVVQTYWPDHPAIQAAALHEPRLFYSDEENVRAALGYPPYGRLANILLWSSDKTAVAASARRWAEALESGLPEALTVLGPSPAPISRLKGVWRWHLLVKGPAGAELAGPLVEIESGLQADRAVAHAIDVDPLDLL
jgi:primosomal protein N' (replication factor Y)